MKFKKTFIALVVLALGAVWLNQNWIKIPGWIASIKDPVADSRPVDWQKGPEKAPAGNNQRPNIIMIVVDDMGINDLSFDGGGLGNGTVKTPNIDGIAAQGVNFSKSYAGNATCTPSRAAMLTGRYPTRYGFEFTVTPKSFAKGIAYFNRDQGARYFEERESQVPDQAMMGLPESEITIAELLKEQGYHTLMLGKWHLGEKISRPEQSGFDEALGFMAGASLFLPVDDPDVVNAQQEFDPIDRFLWANMPFAVQYNGSQRFAPSKYMTDYLTDEALKAIEANQNRPFFMYLAYNAPHTPLQALKSDYDELSHISNHTERVYASMVKALDRGVGKVQEKLAELNLDDNTLIMFTSDNGGAHYVGLPDLNKPYRGWKLTFFEGGIKVPTFMKWPGRIKANSVYEYPVGHVDLFSTAAAAAGAELPVDRKMDGTDLVAHLEGGLNVTETRPLYWRSGHYKAVQSEGWKLQLAERPDKKWLFDLNSDPTEQRNVAANYPGKLAEMMQLLNEIDSQQSKPLWPSLIETPIPIDKPLSEAKLDLTGDYVYWAN